MNEYELCALFSGQQTREKIDELAKQVEDLLAQARAEVKFSHSLGRKKLAYKIKGQTHGEYRCWLFSADSSEIPALNEKLRLSQSIMRHLISKFENITIKDRIAKIKDYKTYKTGEKKEESPGAKPLGKKKIEPENQEQEKTSKKEKKISLDQLDKKLDELLESDKI